jgi:hypothetical protein
VIDPMSGGGSIPLESARLGFKTYANELNPVACTVLEATVDYPFRFGPELAEKTRKWGRELVKRIEKRLADFFPKRTDGLVHAYIFARTVPCPDTQHPTPLVPDWHLLKPKGSERRVVAEPVVDAEAGTWSVRIREVGRHAGQLKEAPLPTYSGGDGISIFTRTKIPGDYIKAMAQNGKMGSALYAVAVKTPSTPSPPLKRNSPNSARSGNGEMSFRRRSIRRPPVTFGRFSMACRGGRIFFQQGSFSDMEHLSKN